MGLEGPFDHDAPAETDEPPQFGGIRPLQAGRIQAAVQAVQEVWGRVDKCAVEIECNDWFSHRNSVVARAAMGITRRDGEGKRTT